MIIEIKPGDDKRIDEQNLLDLCDAELGADNTSPELRKGFFLGFRSIAIDGHCVVAHLGRMGEACYLMEGAVTRHQLRSLLAALGVVL